MSDQNATPGKRALTTIEQVACAIPLVLVFIGGAIGGAAGGIAWAVNQKIMRSNAPAPVRYGLTVLTFGGAVALYLAALFALVTLFPDVFS